MPEGDTVYRLCKVLHAALGGEQLTSTQFRVPQLATVDLAGYRVAEVVPRGKHLLMRLHSAEATAAEELTLHSHLMMDGSWQLYEPAERWRRPAHTARVVLRTATTSAIGFEIQQVQLVPTDQEDELIGHLGPDLLGENWNPDLALANLRACPERAIGTALLDQRIMAGIGNIYRAEILFLTRTHPLTPIGRVKDLGAVVAMAHRLLHANKDRSRRVTTGDPRAREPVWVYARAGKPCLRCGGKVQLFSLADEESGYERDCYYCAACQQMGE